MFENFGNLVASFVNLVKSGRMADVLRALPVRPTRITVDGALKFNAETPAGMFSVGESVNGSVDDTGALSIAPSIPAIFYNGRPITMQDVTSLGLSVLTHVVTGAAPPVATRALPTFGRPVRVPSRDASVVRVPAAAAPAPVAVDQVPAPEVEAVEPPVVDQVPAPDAPPAPVNELAHVAQADGFKAPKRAKRASGASRK